MNEYLRFILGFRDVPIHHHSHSHPCLPVCLSERPLAHWKIIADAVNSSFQPPHVVASVVVLIQWFSFFVLIIFLLFLSVIQS